MAIRSEEMDISETSNSAKWSCRQNISEGWAVLTERSIASGCTTPWVIGRVRGLSDNIMLKPRLGTGHLPE